MIREKLGKLRNTISASLITMYVAATSKLNEIKNDEDGMEVIQVVMIIAIGVLAIVAIWAAVNGYLEDLWETIIGAERPDGPTLETT